MLETVWPSVRLSRRILKLQPRFKYVTSSSVLLQSQFSFGTQIYFPPNFSLTHREVTKLPVIIRVVGRSCFPVGDFGFYNLPSLLGEHDPKRLIGTIFTAVIRSKWSSNLGNLFQSSLSKKEQSPQSALNYSLDKKY